MKEAEEVKVSDVPKDKQKIFKINRGKAREKGGPLTKAEKGGKPQEEMFAMDIPEFEKVENQVDLLVDSAVGECAGDDNAMQNEPSDKPEEELSRAHYDIAGYGDPENEEDEYPPGPQDSDQGIEKDDSEDLYNQGGMSMGEQLNFILSEKGEYHAFFKRMMDSEGISGIGQLPPEKKKEFFTKVSAGWKKEKGMTVAESFGMLKKKK